MIPEACVALHHPAEARAGKRTGGGKGAMATTPAQINLWMQSRSEHQRLEFKEEG